ncbi:MAG: UDP-N-acetylglucosamine diphosphorylase [Puniceicoccales bacterium]|jgi:NDP-sugar pyrophosphorylase family protein|nr:UDP-N-acetylglucosamine diphosphorylase [Puniceicoccales bacterium]
MQFCDFFDIDESWVFSEHFLSEKNPVFWLRDVNGAILDVTNETRDRRSGIPSGCHIGENVFIHESVTLPPICVIDGPAYIGEGTIVRPFAYVRGNVITGKKCLIGNSCELKNSILLDGVQVPHFNYVGDSVLGNLVHLGAGVILANLRLDHGEVTIHCDGERIPTAMRKVGAIIGDRSEIACNCVLNPGTVVPRHSRIFANGAYSRFA